MTTIIISREKYLELCLTIAHPVLGIEAGAFEDRFNCKKRQYQLNGDCVELLFSSEEDAVIFTLTYI